MSSEPSDRDFNIDELKLDREWIKQARTLRKYGLIQAEAQREYDAAKTELDLVAAELDLLIRKNPAKYGLVKVTDKAIEAKIPTMPRHKEAQQRVQDARYELDVAKVAVTAMEHKKRALEKLVDLFLSEYYAEPIQRRHSGEVEEMRKRTARTRGRVSREDE